MSWVKNLHFTPKSSCRLVCLYVCFRFTFSLGVFVFMLAYNINHTNVCVRGILSDLFILEAAIELLLGKLFLLFIFICYIFWFYLYSCCPFNLMWHICLHFKRFCHGNIDFIAKSRRIFWDYFLYNSTPLLEDKIYRLSNIARNKKTINKKKDGAKLQDEQRKAATATEKIALLSTLNTKKH